MSIGDYADKEPKTEPKPEGNQYNLKPIEANILLGIRQQMDGITSLVLSYIAVDRLAYEVKQTTQFALSDDFKTLTITEMAPPAETPKAEPAGEGDTANAIKSITGA